MLKYYKYFTGLSYTVQLAYIESITVVDCDRVVKKLRSYSVQFVIVRNDEESNSLCF